MSVEPPTHLILNSPYEEPTAHWLYRTDTGELSEQQGRRAAGYFRTSPGYKGHGEDPGVFVELPLVNTIRPRVAAWRKDGYPGVSGMTRRLLRYWNDPEERSGMRFFFCQLEAMETLIWWTEAPESQKTGIEIPLDGGEFRRLCAKMATGTGKTVVMAMVIAWHILNKVASPQDTRFSKHVFIVAPGLTVKNRLSVLQPSDPNNYYTVDFDIVPTDLMDKLRQGKVRICNWHMLAWEKEEQINKKKSVVKRGEKSDEAYTREVLGEMAGARNILVINDEAHHAWRISPEVRGQYLRQRDMKDSTTEATVWVGGLDRIHKTRRILASYDFSATPFAPSGYRGSEEELFSWIVSDFGLSDAIESGLVKTPRVVVRDDALPDAKTYKSRLYHLYNDPEVKDDLNRKAGDEEPLPDLVVNAYILLGHDWRETMQVWRGAQMKTPPVMITVANRTETAARISHALKQKRIRIDELCEPAHMLHIDSEVLARAEARDEVSTPDRDADDAAEETTSRLTKVARAERLREQVDTVGKEGEAGEQIRKVISVGMLSEGWDAKTVTHIMGLRAFTSQLLCEQVVGRGLRRTSYEIQEETGHFAPEYVNVFGVPFNFLPHDPGGGVDVPPTPPKIAISPDPAKKDFAIRWPNVVRIEHVWRARLSLDWNHVETLNLDASQTPSLADLAPVVDGKPDVTNIREIDLEKLAQESRMQKIVFETARDVYDRMKETWEGGREYLIAQVVALTEQCLRSDRIAITPALFNQDALRRRLMLILNMSKIVNHLWRAIRFENNECVVPVFDKDHPIRSTGDARTWYTGRPCEYTKRSHINRCVFDSTWEASEACELDRNRHVDAWVKNDHLGFDILYIHNGVVRKYRPDFIIRMQSGDFLVLEVKGENTALDNTKRRFLEEWVLAVTTHGGFGRWFCAVSRTPGDIKDILARHAGVSA